MSSANTDHNMTTAISFIEWRDTLHKEIRGSKLMYDVPHYYKWLEENELYKYYTQNINTL